MAKNQLIITCFFIVFLILNGCNTVPNQSDVDPMQRSSDLGFVIDQHQKKLNDLDYYRIEEYPYQSELLNDYQLEYIVDTADDDWIQYLLLMKGNQMIDTISGMSYGLKFRNLGFVAHDYPDFFVFSHSFGFWDACPSDLIEKKSGESMFWGFLVDSCNEYLFLTHSDFLDESDTIFCYDVNSRDTELCRATKNVFGSAEELGTSSVHFSAGMYFLCNSNGLCEELRKF